MSTELRMEELKKPKKYTVEQKLGILREWEKRGNGVEMAKQYGLHPYTLYRWKKRLEQGAREWLRGSKPKKALALKRLEEENWQLKETLAAVTQELMLLKKETRWGLSGHQKGERLMNSQKAGVIEVVQSGKAQAVPITQTLQLLGLPRSSYYRWRHAQEPEGERSPSRWRLRPEEQAAIRALKQAEPWLSPPTISGRLRQQGVIVSPSSAYRVLKAEGWVEPPTLRERPWDSPRYEPFRPNQLWGADWSLLRIAGVRWYLVTVIDYFSRLIVAWTVVPTVTQREVQALVAMAVLDQHLDQIPPAQRPKLRLDRGAPNTATVTQEVLHDLGLLLSLARPQRPTDNARQERGSRPLKQEEVYVMADYPSLDVARDSLGCYIEVYNTQRPHQALWGFTPWQAHQVGNHTRLREHLRDLQAQAREARRRYWREQKLLNQHLSPQNLS